MNMFDLCVHFQGVLSNPQCDDLIQTYESNKSKAVNSNDINVGIEGSSHSTSNWNEMRIDYPPFSERYLPLISQKNEELYKAYRDRFKEYPFFWPVNYNFKHPRIKKYEPNEKDKFDWHADATSQATSTRFLVFLYYLNDVEEGGETAIATDSNNALLVKPKQGSVLVFPPYWMFTHSGLPPISNPKYIISSYGWLGRG